MFRERDLVRIVGVRLVRVDGLRAIWVLGRLYYFSDGGFAIEVSVCVAQIGVAYGRGWSIAKLGCGHAVLIRWESWHWRRRLKAPKLRRGVHLWWDVGGNGGVWSTIAVMVRHSSSPRGGSMVLV